MTIFNLVVVVLPYTLSAEAMLFLLSSVAAMNFGVRRFASKELSQFLYSGAVEDFASNARKFPKDASNCIFEYYLYLWNHPVLVVSRPEVSPG